MKHTPSPRFSRFFAAAAVALAAASATLPARAAEWIDQFDSRIEVQENGDLVVTEKIRVHAEGEEIKHGIFRDIPVLQKGKWGLKSKKPFEIVSVERDGHAEPYAVEKASNGMLRIRIGRESFHLKDGYHDFTIIYRTERQLYPEKNRDVLYWNVNGTEWGFRIQKMTATVVLPEGIEISKAWGYTGKSGETGEDYTVRIDGNTAAFETTRSFDAGENLTVTVEWSPGLLAPAAYKGRGFMKDHPGAALGLALMSAAFLYYLFAWVLVGRDPEKGTIIPLYDPPKGFSPAAVRYLSNMGFDNTCFSAGVVGLAVKGTVTIEQEGKSYTLEKNRGETAELLPDERRLYRELMDGISQIELKQSNHTRIGKARKALKKALATQLEKSHFMRNLKWWLPGLVLSMGSVAALLFLGGASPISLFMIIWLSIWTVGTGALVSATVGQWRSGSAASALPMALFAIPFLLAWIAGCWLFFHAAGPWAVGALVTAAAMNTVFYHLIKAPTRLGRRIMDQIDGFKQYLAVAEEDRLNLLNPPEKTPELFERFLPFALALDCEQKWAEKFDEVLKTAGTAPGEDGGYSPSFYTGSYTGMDRAMGAAALGGALTGALASSASAPSSSGGSSGGFSGGGGGGGGGGGW